MSPADSLCKRFVQTTLQKAQRHHDLPYLVLRAVTFQRMPWKPGKGCAGCLKA